MYTNRPEVVRKFDDAMRHAGPFEPRAVLMAAVSGGPDSLALAVLAASWSRHRDSTLICLVIDHGLRAESSDEARQARVWLETHGLRTLTVSLRNISTHRRLQLNARNQRYRTIEKVARRTGTLHVLLGHHMDDQTETLFMRSARSPDIIGLAGIPKIRELAHCRIVRPLLNCYKQELEQYLFHNRQSWISDPSNDDRRFERVRVRTTLQKNSRNFRSSASCRNATEHDVAEQVALSTRISPFGYAIVNFAKLVSKDPNWIALVMSRLMSSVAGHRRYLPRNKLLKTAQRLTELQTKAQTSIAGCQIQSLGAMQYLVVREWTRTRPSSANDGNSVFWDGRFRVTSEFPMVEVGALGLEGWSRLANSCRRIILDRAVPRAAAMALPIVRSGKGEVIVPKIGGLEVDELSKMCTMEFLPAISVADTPFDDTIVVWER